MKKKKPRYLRHLPVQFPWCLCPEVEPEAVLNTSHLHGAHCDVLRHKSLLLSTWDWDFPRGHLLLTIIPGQWESNILLPLLHGSFWSVSEDNHGYFIGPWYFSATKELQDSKGMVFSSCSSVTLSRFCFTTVYRGAQWTHITILSLYVGLKWGYL
jgi:hypothetical protein